MRYCQIETLQPAYLTFQGPKNDIAIFASKDVLTESIETNKTATGAPADSLIANILFSLQRIWEKAPGYEDTRFSIYIMDTDELYGAPNFDMAVLLEKLQITNAYFGQEFDLDVWEAYLFVQYLAKWSMRNKSWVLIDEYSDIDLMEWPSGIHQGKLEAVEHLPDVKDAWWDMGIAMAQNYADRIAPRWQTGMRHIYMVNKFPELSQRAYTAMQNGAYSRAFNIWEDMFLSCRKFFQNRVKSQITYNMAVTYEFQNQIDQAVYWAQRSVEMKRKNKTVAYLKLLRERQQHHIQLDLQTSTQTDQ